MAGPGGAEVGRVSVRVVPDTSRFRRDAKKGLERAVKGLKVKVDVDPDLTGFRSKVAAATKGMSTRVKVDVDRSHLGRSLAGATKNLKAKVEVDVDRGKLAKTLGLIGKVFSAIGDKFNPNTGLLQKLGGGGDISQLLLVLAVVLLIAPAISLIATLLAGIPALVSGLGVAFAALYLGAEGIKNAFAKISPQIEQMKKSLSAVTEKTFTPLFKQLADVGTAVTPALAGVVTGLGAMTKGFTDALSSAQGMRLLNNIIDRSGELFAQLGPHIGTLTTSFLRLASLGADSFSTLAGSVGDFIGRFDTWVSKLASDNVLPGAFKGLRQSLDGLGKLFFDLMDVGVRAMGELGPHVQTFLSSLGDFATSIFPIFSSIFKWFSRISSALMNAFGPIIETIAPVFDKLMMAFARIGEAIFNTLGPAINAVLKPMFEGLSKVLDTMAPVLDAVATSFEKLGQTFAEAFTENAGPINEAFQKLATSLVELAPQLVNLVTQLTQVAVEALPKLVEVLPELIASFMTITNSGIIEAFTQALVDLAPHLPTIVSGLTMIATAAVTVVAANLRLIAIFMRLVAVFGSVVSYLLGLGRRLVAGLVTVPHEIIQGMISGWNSGWGGFIGAVKGAFTGFINAVKGILGIASPSTVFAQIGRDIIQGLINGIKAMMGAAVAAAQAIANAVKNVFTGIKGFLTHSPSRFMTTVGENVTQGLANGMTNEQIKAERSAERVARATKNAWAKGLKGMENIDLSKVEITKKPTEMRMREQLKKVTDDVLKDLPKDIGMSWVDAITSDLGFSRSGAIGNLMEQIFDPKVELQDLQDVYIVKDVTEAERRADARKRKKALQAKKTGA